jgi:Sigma-70 factor, region 1.1
MSSDGNLPADILSIAQVLIERGDDVTIDELNALLAGRDLGAAEFEELVNTLARNGINVVFEEE